MFKSSGLWYKFDIDYILGKGDYLFKFIGEFRYLGMEELPQGFLIVNVSVNVKFLEIELGNITAGGYLLSITEIVNIVQQIGTDVLLINNN